MVAATASHRSLLLAARELLIDLERTDLTAASPAESIHVPLGTARQLTLVADFGPGFDLGDHCAFARARLVADD